MNVLRLFVKGKAVVRRNAHVNCSRCVILSHYTFFAFCTYTLLSTNYILNKTMMKKLSAKILRLASSPHLHLSSQFTVALIYPLET